MAEQTEISWCDHTFNPWWGCVEISLACDHCYARTLARRFGYQWGTAARRRFFDDLHWREPLLWNRKAEREGQSRRVFCASMADVFERLPKAHPDRAQMDAERARLWMLIAATPWLTWLLLTKRPQNIARMVPGPWMDGHWPCHVWPGVTAETQEWLERRWRRLRNVPAWVRFISAEPLLGPLDLDAADPEWWESCNQPLWIIAGGESGHEARPSHPDWFRALRDQCVREAAPFHFKQWGEWLPFTECSSWANGRYLRDPRRRDILRRRDGTELRGRFERRTLDADQPTGTTVYRVGKKAAGRTLDGRTWEEFPEVRHA